MMVCYAYQYMVCTDILCNVYVYIPYGKQKHLGYKKSGVAKKSSCATKRTDIGMWPRLMHPGMN